MAPDYDDRRSRAARSRSEILDVATSQFAGRGYDGVTVDEIAAATSTTKRMIYYYFGGKEQLYTAVLARAVQAVRADPLPPGRPDRTGLDKVRSFAGRMFERHQAHPEFARLLTVENLAQGRRGPRSDLHADLLGALGRAGHEVLTAALAEGVEQGVVRPGVDPWDLFLVINGFCVSRIANRFTLRRMSGLDPLDDAVSGRHREVLDDLVLRYVRREGPAPSAGPS